MLSCFKGDSSPADVPLSLAVVSGMAARGSGLEDSVGRLNRAGAPMEGASILDGATGCNIGSLPAPDRLVTGPTVIVAPSLFEQLVAKVAAIAAKFRDLEAAHQGLEARCRDLEAANQGLEARLFDALRSDLVGAGIIGGPAGGGIGA